MTFVADESDPEGGLFYAGQQNDSQVFAFRLPIRSSRTSTDVSFQFSFPAAPRRTDLSGMHYDARNDVLYAIWDGANRMRAMRPDGTLLSEWILPGTAQEGITFHGNDLLIAQENARIMLRYPSFPIAIPEPASCRLVFYGALTLMASPWRPPRRDRQAKTRRHGVRPRRHGVHTEKARSSHREGTEGGAAKLHGDVSIVRRSRYLEPFADLIHAQRHVFR